MTVAELSIPVQYVVDETGHKKAVQIDLTVWKQILTLLTGQYLSAVEVARRVQVNLEMLESWLANGTLPGIKINGQWLVSVEVMNRFAPLEEILDELDAEKSPPGIPEIVAMVNQGRESWTWGGRE